MYHPSLRQNENFHAQLETWANLQTYKLFSLSQQPPVMKNEDVSVFKLIKNKLGIKAFRYVSCPHATTKLYFS